MAYDGGSSVRRRRRGGGGAPSPLAIFGSRLKFWADPSDVSSMWQDSTMNTTRVAALNDPIGGIGDKSLGGKNAIQATSTSRPLWKQDGNGCFYASFDGTDDSWATSAIDFSASDKIAVFAAVRKLADTTGFIAELSANSSTGNNGTFAVYSQTSDLYVRSGGTTRVSLPGNGGATNSPAPITRVVSNIGDISAPSLRNLVNGSQANIDTTSQGTGNFGNYPLYLGGRAGISNFFNGAVYQLFIVQGAVTAAEIAAANAYCNIKSKAY